MRAVTLNCWRVCHGRDQRDFDDYTHITLDESVTYLPADTFKNCKNLVSVIGESVRCLSRGVFACCTNLTYVKLDDSVTTVGTNAFLRCIALQSIEFDIIHSVYAFAFAESGLVDLKLSATYFGAQSFYLCKSLRNITFVGSVADIDTCAFFGCDSLRRVELPASFRSRATNVFSGPAITLDLSKCADLAVDNYLVQQEVRAVLFHPDVYTQCLNLISDSYAPTVFFRDDPIDRLKFLRLGYWSRDTFHTHSTLKQTIATLLTIACRATKALPILPNFIWLQIIRTAFD